MTERPPLFILTSVVKVRPRRKKMKQKHMTTKALNLRVFGKMSRKEVVTVSTRTNCNTNHERLKNLHINLQKY